MNDPARPSSAPTIAIATTELNDVPQPSVTISGITSGVEDGQHVAVTLDGKSYDAVVTGSTWSVCVPMAVAVLPDGGYKVTASVSNKAGIPAPPDTQTWKRRESGLDLPPEQTPELEQAASEAKRRWITKEAAIKWFEEQCATWVEPPHTTCTPSPGYARELLAKARASDPGSQSDLFFNLDDLVGWRDRHMSRKEPAIPALTPAPARQKPRGGNKHARATAAIKALMAEQWRDVLPDKTQLPPGDFCQVVRNFLRADCREHGLLWVDISNDTISLARKKLQALLEAKG